MNVAFRVDASGEIGSGHFMRCLTLADALSRRGAQIRFLSRQLPAHLRDSIVDRDYEFELLDAQPFDGATEELLHSRWLGTSQLVDAEQSARALADRNHAWLVVDHYALDVRWETMMRNRCAHILVIDDLADRRHNCDILLDQNLYAEMIVRYADKVSAGARLLLGPSYALLRPEFRRSRNRAMHAEAVERILISFGGSDPENLTLRAMDAVSAVLYRGLQVDVVIGAGHPMRGSIESECHERGFACHVQTDRMAELMAAADIAIGAGGSAVWERCCVGLPTLALCAAENQRQQIQDAAVRGLLYAPGAQSSTSSGIAVHLKALLDNPSLLQAVSRAGQSAVDGRGVERVLRAMGLSPISIREATQTDSEVLFSGRNHAAVRQVSRNANPIEWASHQEWLTRALANPDRVLLIGEREGVAVGVVRFDVTGDEAEVSIYLLPDLQESGLGSDLLSAAESWLAANRDSLRTLTAEVMGDNQRSHGLFLANGYARQWSRYGKQVSGDE